MASSKRRRRVFVECSYTYFAGGSTGIRRVARNLANLGPVVSDPAVQILPIVWGGIGFFTPRGMVSDQPHFVLNLLQRGRLVANRATLARQKLADRTGAFCSRLCSFAGPKLGGALRTGGHVALGWLRAAWRALRKLLHRGMKQHGGDELMYLLFGLVTFPVGFWAGSRVKFRPDDIVVLVDSTWNSDRMLGRLIEAQEKSGIKLGVMIHDLFPLTIAEMCHADTVGGYRRWFDVIAPAADFFVTNSEATRQALECYLMEHQDIRTLPVSAGSFPLGADLDQAWRSTPVSPLRQRIRDLPGFVMLAVGTIEPRKNYAAILDAFDMVASRQPVTLVIVGRPGWKSHDEMGRIADHPLNGERLLHLDDADDSELAEALDRANCLVCASWAEGFGLPVVEGLMRGLPVIASDIPVFHEVGAASCTYFAPDAPHQLAKLIEAMAASDPHPGPAVRPDTRAWIDWEESTRRFRDRVLELAER